MTAGRAVLLPIAVYAWQVLGAGYTFRAVTGERISTSGRAWLISVGFVALVANAGDELVNPLLLALGCVGLIAALALFEWARRTVRGQFFSWIFSSDTPAFLCTSGPYAYARNPFYTSYLLTMASTLASTAVSRPRLSAGSRATDSVTSGVMTRAARSTWGGPRRRRPRGPSGGAPTASAAPLLWWFALRLSAT